MSGQPAFHLDRIRRYYQDAELTPLEPDEYVEKLGGFLFDYMETTMSILFPRKVPVLCGYYANNVKTEQRDIRKFFPNPADRQPILMTNVMLYRFLQELYLLEASGNPVCVLGMFRKYMPKLVGDPDPVLKAFLDEFPSADMQCSQEQHVQATRLAFVSTTFTLVHESIHLMPDLYASAEQMIRAVTQFQGLDDALIRELACDFCALYLICSPQQPLFGHLNCTADEAAFCSLMALHAESLYLYFRHCLMPEGGPAVDVGEALSHPLTTRLQNLCLAVRVAAASEKNPMDFGALDILAAVQRYSHLITEFIGGNSHAVTQISAIFKNNAAEETSGLSIEPIGEIDPENIWFRVG